MRTLLCSNVRLIYVPPLRAKPRDCTGRLLRWRTAPPCTATVHQILHSHFAHASRCSYRRSCEHACRAAFNAHLRAQSRASEESRDGSTSRGMSSG